MKQLTLITRNIYVYVERQEEQVVSTCLGLLFLFVLIIAPIFLTYLHRVHTLGY